MKFINRLLVVIAFFNGNNLYAACDYPLVLNTRPDYCSEGDGYVFSYWLCTGCTFIWNNGSTSYWTNWVSAGLYSVTVTDDSGCVYIGSAFVTSTPSCDDGDLCTDDICSYAPDGLCDNVPIDCDDAVPCTDDICDDGNCSNNPDDAFCDDEIECTVDFCDRISGCFNDPTFDPACDDLITCTQDICDASGCKNIPYDFFCDDLISCTEDVCDEETGCDNIPDDNACDDGNACTEDICDAAFGFCRNNLETCDDQDACTTDHCDIFGVCQNMAIICIVSNPCYYVECLNGICVPNPIDCDDSDPCTVDNCNNGSCLHPLANCDDGLLCTTDGCDEEDGCFNTLMDCTDTNPCTTDNCSNGTCINILDCNDNDACTSDVCGGSFGCVHTEMDCDDNDPCSSDVCVNGACEYNNSHRPYSVQLTQDAIQVQSLKAISASDIWGIAFGQNTSRNFEVIRSTDGGRTWENHVVPNTTGLEFNNIIAVNAQTAWIGAFPNNFLISSIGGAIYKTSNGGVTWQQQNSGAFVGGFLDFVYFFNANEGVAVGDPNGGYFEIWTTSNGGNNWNRVSGSNIPVPLASEGGTSGYFGVSNGNLYFNTNYDRLFVTHDKGLSWAVSQMNIGYSTEGFHINNAGTILERTSNAEYKYSIDNGQTVFSHTHVDASLDFHLYGETTTGNEFFSITYKNTPQKSYLYRSTADLSQDWEKADSIAGLEWLYSAKNAFYNRNLGWILGATVDANHVQNIYRFEDCNDNDPCTIDDCDPLNGCIHTLTCNLNISGGVVSELNAPIPTVTIKMQSTVQQIITTLNDGLYSFNAAQGSSYIISPSKTNDVTANNGVNTLDILLVRRHLLAIQALSSPYKIIAADVNGSSSVSTTDILLMRQMILAITTSFPNGKLWSFVPGNYGFANLQNPFPYDNFRTYNNLNTNQTSQNFIGIKLGDVNNSWNPNTPKEGAIGNLQLAMDEYHVLPNDEIAIPIKVRDFKNITGYQFTLSWNPEVLSLLDVSNKSLTAYYGIQKTIEGYLTSTWYDDDTKDITLDDDETVFELKFKVIGVSGTQSEIKIGSELTASEAYNENLDLLNIVPTNGMVKVGDTTGLNIPADDCCKLQIIPNPFSNTTSIIFTIPHDETMTLSIYDILGREVKRLKADYKTGEHQVEWVGDDEGGNVLGKGLYHVRVVSGKHSISAKALLIR